MTDEIYAKCDCLSGQMKWDLSGVLNTAELVANKNLKELKEELQGVPSEKIPEFEKMALKKLEADLKSIAELKKELEKIATCG